MFSSLKKKPSRPEIGMLLFRHARLDDSADRDGEGLQRRHKKIPKILQIRPESLQD
jgi:hypothetical protein